MTSNLIILDADIIIHLHELDMWRQFTNVYTVFITRTVFQDEALHFEKDDFVGQGTVYLKLEDDRRENRIEVIDLDAHRLIEVGNKMSNMKVDIDTVHIGEMETISAAYHRDDLVLCLNDGAAITCAVLIDLKERCISLKQALELKGLNSNVGHAFNQARFDSVMRKAEAERVIRLTDML